MRNNKQKTAVQLIIQALDIECKSRGMNVNWDMYLKTEEEQIAEAYWNGSDGIEDKTSMLKIGEEYYKETYGDDH